VEIGAYDGLLVSNTWGLAERGWAGLLIEPVPELAEACRKHYAHRERVEVHQVAIGAAEKLIEIQYAGALSTANSEAFREYSSVSWAKSSLTTKKYVVQCQTLDQVLVQHNVTAGFELLVVDVEGFESEVFRGFRLDYWWPKMIIVELVDTHPDLVTTGSADAALGQQIVDTGYVVVYKDAINTVFVRKNVWQEAFRSD
jgi:FkbM family methyltransferase